MAMQTTFKKYARGTRTMIVEDNYSKGMFYTNTPLADGYLKCLTNYDYKDSGSIMTPRYGYCAQKLVADGELKVVEQSLLNGSFTNYPLMTYVGLNDLTARLENVFLAGYCDANDLEAHDKTYNTFPADQCKLYTTNINSTITPSKTTDAVTSKDVRTFSGSTVPKFLSVVAPDIPIHDCSTQQLNTNAIIATAFDNVMLAICAHGNDFKLSKVSFVAGSKFGVTALTPSEISIAEAVTSGYNMLQEDPYSFSDKAGTGYGILGIIPYDSTGADRKIKLSARVGETINYQVYYAYNTTDNATYRLKIEWAGGNTPDTWNVIQTELKAGDDNLPAGAILSPTYAHGAALKFAWAPTVPDYSFKVTLFKSQDDMTTAKPLAQMVMTMPSLSNSDASKMSAPVNYDLATAIGLTTWKQRLVAWGVKDAVSTLFVSDINNPNYFPYPNNIEHFNEPIVHVVPFMDSLLVFTRTKLHLLNLQADGISYTTVVVQDRLHIAETDKYAIQVIKNMVFFKSGNYYYMIVPKATSLTGELVIAPISKPITNFLDNFKDGVLAILNHMYYNILDMEDLYENGFSIISYYTYLDGNAIRNVYLLELQGYRVNVILNYDTTLRNWTTYVHETPGYTIPWLSSITQATLLFSVGPESFYTETVEDEEKALSTCVPYICAFNQADRKDYRRKVTNGVVTTTPSIKNYQFLDTGYREHTSQLKKRYREIQFTINNASQKILTMSSAFYIDDDRRVSYYKRTATHDTDPNSQSYGLFFMDTTPIDNTQAIQEAKYPMNNTIVVPGTTLLNGEYQDDGWVLDFSKFPDLATAKIRLPVSGKGYAPRFKLLAYNEESFELKNINWVFRDLYAR